MTQNGEGIERTYCRMFDCEVSRIGHSFENHVGLMWIPMGAKPNVDLVRSFFQKRIDPLVKKVVIVCGVEVSTAWEDPPDAKVAKHEITTAKKGAAKRKPRRKRQ